MPAAVEALRTTFYLGRSQEAADLFQNLVITCRLEHPDDGGLLAHLLSGQASLFNATGRYAEAVDPAREALQVFQELYGESFWRVAAAKLVLGEALLASKQIDAAEPLLSEGYASLLSAPGEASANEAMTAAGRIRALYTAQGRSDLAAEWQQR
ncbi:MAG: tetratricopeptide repeat protein [bacterium]|nr:tetratricopeptide repeat protein [bacterium]